MKVRIDLHTHTSASILNGDHRIDFESVEKAILKFRDYNVKIASFSDHNTFNVDFYLKAKEIGKKFSILFLPAIEVNVKRKSDNRLANIIYVFDDNLSKEQLNKITSIANLKLHKKGISNFEVNQLFSEFEHLKIPHIGKSDSFKFEDLEGINVDAIEISSYDNPNFLRTLRRNYQGSIVAFSDTHIWSKYPELNKLITEIELDDHEEINYKNLKKALSLKKDYTKIR